VEDLKVGWAFLRREPVLLANTIQGAVGQFAIGVIGAVAYVYAEQVLSGAIEPEAAYSFLETAIGVGNLVGGVGLGLVAARVSKGSLVIGGYLLFGACVVLLGLASALPLAVGLMVGAGIANMIYVIPSQTLFQERTPQDLIGRVVGFRFAIVFGSMTIAAPIAGVATEVFGAAAVIAFAGVLSLLAGVAGLGTRAVRDA
jgi:MFS family permease